MIRVFESEIVGLQLVLAQIVSDPRRNFIASVLNFAAERRRSRSPGAAYIALACTSLGMLGRGPLYFT